ncbi:hypothetical protein K432DRAFT_392821 [Lepidopterella palustris CBS 459.81]|uniref:Glutaminase A central domain-containing protein n=1 Tax=Lepidopterella palustris CBS 459.81 TaxID=1314670 RepID=A0A8E2EBG4_9PEZI|nr:hypothetical protein K432DRAFT_392821 [Lepidopterella palustris CBS 459.81]
MPPGGANPSNTNDILAFMKERSSNGDITALDVMLSAILLFYVVSPEYIRLLLEPEPQYLSTEGPNQAFPVHDRGTHPNVLDHDNDNGEPMPVEENSVLLTASLWRTNATGNAPWSGPAGTYTPLLKKYADLSVESNGLHIPSQRSTVDGLGPMAGKTNLAITSMVALNTFSVLSGNSSHSKRGLYYASQLYNSTGGLGQVLVQPYPISHYKPETCMIMSTSASLLPGIFTPSSFSASALSL